MSFLLRRSKRRFPNVNLIPLIDVFVVLIFFFLLTMQFRSWKSMSITPPKLQTAGINYNQDAILIIITAEGHYLYNNQLVTDLELFDALKLASQVDRKQNLVILADEDAFLKHVATVIDTARSLGFESIKLQSR
jgi:biopolymer transport protein ExbD